MAYVKKGKRAVRAGARKAAQARWAGHVLSQHPATVRVRRFRARKAAAAKAERRARRLRGEVSPVTLRTRAFRERRRAARQAAIQNQWWMPELPESQARALLGQTNPSWDELAAQVELASRWAQCVA